MIQKIFKIGNSLGVVIPSEFIQSLGIRAGDKVKVTLFPGKSKVTYQFSGIFQLPLSEEIFEKRPACRQAGKNKKHEAA